MNISKQLKNRLLIAVIVLLITLLVTSTATFAWYVYQTGARTTNVKMAVGAGISLQISNEYDKGYSNSTVMEAFQGRLTPVSTNRITGGFQKVTKFQNSTGNQNHAVAAFFGESESSDYYKTSLYVKAKGNKRPVYLSDIGYEDTDEQNPLSTAIRVGLVVHEPGKDTPVAAEYIFTINTGDNPQAQYNTATGMEGYVLDCEKTDGTTVPLTQLYTPDNYCRYDNQTGEVTVSDESLALFDVEGTENNDFGTPVQIDVYIWLEGCDKDCTNNLMNKTLKNIAISFVCELSE